MVTCLCRYQLLLRYVCHYETRKAAMCLAKWQFFLFCILYVIMCQIAGRGFEICNFMLYLGEWDLIGAKRRSHFIIFCLNILFSNMFSRYQTFKLAHAEI